MRFLSWGLLAALVAGAAIAEQPNDCGVRDALYPASFATASMLNGEFWAQASPDVRHFYVRTATEAVKASQTAPPPASVVGWTYPQFVEWIDEFYASDVRFQRLPVAVVFTYAMRARNGETREALTRDAKDMLQRLRRIDPNHEDR